MSRRMSRHEYENWTAIGAWVWFDGPDGERLHGEIVRTSSNGDYYHVLVDNDRYEVSLNRDNMGKTRDGGY